MDELKDQDKKQLENYLTTIIYTANKATLIILDTILQKSNNFEEFKNGIRQTVENLTKQ